MVQSLSFSSALDAVAAGGLLLTANKRLAREMRHRYDLLQVEQGAMVWEQARILPWDAWLERCFEQLLDLGFADQLLLTNFQERLLWEQVIQDSASGEDNPLLRPAAAARTAEAAWRLVQEWMIPRDQLEAWATPETELFLCWADRFLGQCRQKGWIDRARLPSLLADHFRAGQLALPNRLLLAGFDERSPRQEQFLTQLANSGCQVQAVGEQGVPQQARRIKLNEPAQELETAARWAARRLASNPDSRIGLIIPRLTELREQVVHTLDQVFCPATTRPATPRYNLSLGKPLACYPVIGDALLLLELTRGELSCGDMGRLLRSPFLPGGGEEWNRRARLDARIREQVGERHISFHTLLSKLRQAEEQERDACPELLRALRRFQSRFKEMSDKGAPGDWAERFLALLQAAGWPGTSHLNSDEYQQVNRFRELLASFASLEIVQSSMNLRKALRRLRAQAEETLFQAESTDAPVQVMGVLEASGLAFDHLWVVGLTDDRWPPAAVPNPLLPQGLQRKLRIPHASAERELAFAELMTERLLASAPEVLVSHAARDGDQSLRPSPLIGGLPEQELEELALAAYIDPYQQQVVTLETFVDDQAPPLAAGSRVPGGTWIFSDQAQCPFRAFALHRLGATTIEEPVSGLDGRDRGSLLHSIMEAVWSRLRDRTTLLSTPDRELETVVAESVAQAIASVSRHKPLTFAPRFTELERERLAALVLQWLELEKERADFTVEALEQRETLSVGELVLDTRADRIDRLGDGALAIIDYKTGSASCSGWFEERLEEPQLPLYAVGVGEEKIGAVLLARLRRGENGFVGVAAEEGVAPRIRAFSESRQSQDYEGWDELFHRWSESLEMLAAEIRAGRADVDPKDPAKSCNYCPLPSLCRIHERQEITMREEA